jgi:hypothetical protein
MRIIACSWGKWSWWSEKGVRISLSVVGGVSCIHGVVSEAKDAHLFWVW